MQLRLLPRVQLSHRREGEPKLKRTDHGAGLAIRHAGVGEWAAVVILAHVAEHAITHRRGVRGTHYGTRLSCWHADIREGTAKLISPHGAENVTIRTLHRRHLWTLLGQEHGGGDKDRGDECFHDEGWV